MWSLFMKCKFEQSLILPIQGTMQGWLNIGLELRKTSRLVPLEEFKLEIALLLCVYRKSDMALNAS